MCTTTAPAWVVAILGGAENVKPDLKGSGILVSERHLISCAHVVCRPDTLKPWPVLKAGFDNSRPLELRFCTATKDDVALLELSEPVRSRCATFLEFGAGEDDPLHIAAGHQFRYSGWIEGGVCCADANAFVGASSLGTVSADIHRSSKGGTLFFFQVTGGVPNGCSGGPLLLGSSGRSWCAGMLRLGGYGAELGGTSRGAATSYALASNWLIQFLRKHGVHPVVERPPAVLKRHEARRPVQNESADSSGKAGDNSTRKKKPVFLATLLCLIIAAVLAVAVYRVRFVERQHQRTIGADLDPEGISLQIDHALQTDDPLAAARALQLIADREIKDEECARVLNEAVRRHKPEVAALVRQSCTEHESAE